MARARDRCPKKRNLRYKWPAKQSMPKGKRARSKQSTLDLQYKQVRRSTRTSTKGKDVDEDAIIQLEERSEDLPTAKSEVHPDSKEGKLCQCRVQRNAVTHRQFHATGLIVPFLEELSVTESEQELLRQFDLNPDFGPSIGEESSSSLGSTASVEATTCVKKFTNSSSYCVWCSRLHVPFSTAQCVHMESQGDL